MNTTVNVRVPRYAVTMDTIQLSELPQSTRNAACGG